MSSRLYIWFIGKSGKEKIFLNSDYSIEQLEKISENDGQLKEVLKKEGVFLVKPRIVKVLEDEYICVDNKTIQVVEKTSIVVFPNLKCRKTTFWERLTRKINIWDSGKE